MPLLGFRNSTWFAFSHMLSNIKGTDLALWIKATCSSIPAMGHVGELPGTLISAFDEGVRIGALETTSNTPFWEMPVVVKVMEFPDSSKRESVHRRLPSRFQLPEE